MRPARVEPGAPFGFTPGLPDGRIAACGEGFLHLYAPGGVRLGDYQRPEELERAVGAELLTWDSRPDRQGDREPLSTAQLLRYGPPFRQGGEVVTPPKVSPVEPPAPPAQDEAQARKTATETLMSRSRGVAAQCTFPDGFQVRVGKDGSVEEIGVSNPRSLGRTEVTDAVPFLCGGRHFLAVGASEGRVSWVEVEPGASGVFADTYTVGAPIAAIWQEDDRVVARATDGSTLVIDPGVGRGELREGTLSHSDPASTAPGSIEVEGDVVVVNGIRIRRRSSQAV